MTLDGFLLVLAGMTTSLLAGTFFGYAVSVNRALHRLADVEYVRAMQHINEVIQNPLFLGTFLAPVVLLPLVTFRAAQAHPARFGPLLVASLVYLAGTFVPTVVGNVPRNQRLARLALDRASAAEISAERRHFEQPWNRLHTVRTVAAVLATLAVFTGCLAA